MSDRTNRDKGRRAGAKKQNKYRTLCGCWLCENGSTKLKILMERSVGKHSSREMAREFY